MRAFLVACRRNVGGTSFLVVVSMLWFAAHVWRIGDGPMGYHEWREADTCMVAWNLHVEEFDMLRPRISVRGDGDGVCGQEFPLLNAVIAGGWTLFGEQQHWWPRLLSITAAIAMIIGLRRLLLDLGWSRSAAGLAAAALACSPLLFFYGRKIIPDMPAAALGLWGTVLARRWIIGQAGWRSTAGGAILFGLVGMIKPIALCIGLPLAVELVHRHGVRALLQPRWWLFGICCLTPMVLWFRHAGGLGGDGYFLLGVPWRRSLEALQAGWPLGKLLVEWPWQLWIGLPLVPAFAIGCWALRRAPWIWWWMAGAFGVLLPFAGQFGPHDYYTLPMAAPCAALSGAGLAWAIRQRMRSIGLVAVILLVVAGPLAFVRVVNRYGVPYDHGAIRAATVLAVPADALVVSYDGVPATLLYRLGRNGWSISTQAELAQLPELVSRGARFLVARGEHRAQLDGLVGEAILTSDDMTVYRLVR